MRRGAQREVVTPEMAVTPDLAVEVNPLNVYDELEHFLDRPNMFSVEPLIKKLVQEAYPDHPEASSYFVDKFVGGRNIQDQVSRFPIFPLSKMKDFDELLVDLVFDWSYPSPKYSFGPQEKLHELVVRSDSEHAHNALVGHITMPFPRDRQTVFDGPDEMQYKGRLVGDLFGAVTYHGTPDLNPLATRSLVEVYKATRPGGFTYEWAKEQEAGLDEEELRYRDRGPTTRNLRDLQDQMLSNFMQYPHATFDELVRETLEAEPVDEKRLHTVITTLVDGRIRKRDDDYYDEIADKVIAPYDQEVAELVKQYIGRAWERGGEAELSRTEISRRLSRRIIEVELGRNVDRDNSDSFRSAPLLKFAMGKHPLRSVHLEMGEGKKSEWVKSPNYNEDLNYLLGLVKGKNIDAIRPLAAWHIAQSFEHDYSYDDKPRRAKVAYMAMADAVLSTEPNDYEDMARKGITGVMDAMGFLLRQVPLAMDHMSEDDLTRLITYRDSYKQYVANLYPGGVDYQPSREADNDEWDEFHKVTALARDFEEMSRQFGERLEWREIQTNPRRYAEYMFTTIHNYAARFSDDVRREGSYARPEQHDFNVQIARLLHNAKDIAVRAVAKNENVDEELVRIVAEASYLQTSYYRTELRYNNKFHLEYARVVLGLQGNLPLKLQVKTLDMIKAGEIYDYMRDEDKSRLRHKLSRANISQ